MGKVRRSSGLMLAFTGILFFAGDAPAAERSTWPISPKVHGANAHGQPDRLERKGRFGVSFHQRSAGWRRVPMTGSTLSM